MKKIFLFLLFNIFFVKSEDATNKDEHIKQMVNYYIEELGYKNMKSITREEFRKLFLKLFENKQKNQESKEDLDIAFSLTNALFDFIVSEKEEKIELNKIYDYFEPNNIVNALKELLKKFGMEKLIDSVSEPFMQMLKENNNKNDNNYKNGEL